MKTRITLCSLALCSLSQADLIVKQTFDGPMKSEMVLSFKGQQMRTDIGKDTSTIMDGATGNMITLMHAQKMVMKTDGSMVKAQMEELKKASPAAVPMEPKATGKQEKEGEYNCEIYETKSDGTTVTMWVAKDYPNYEAINKEMALATGALSASYATQAAALPGMVLKTVMVAGGQTMTTKLVSVENKAVDAAVFVAPAEYKDPTAAMPKP